MHKLFGDNKNIGKNVGLLLCICLLAFALMACSSGGSSDEKTTVADTTETVTGEAADTQESDSEPAETETEPAEIIETDVNAVSVEVTTENFGTQEEQYAHIAFTFDGTPGTVLKKDFSVTLVGNELEAGRLSVDTEGDQVILTMHVEAVKAGVVEVDYSGKGVHPFLLHAIVSPGMNLEMVSQDEEKAEVTMKVAELYHIRGIARVVLLEDGEPVMTQGEESNVFTGVHGHNFLQMDENTIAEKIAFGLGESFPEGYEATYEGNQVTVKKLDADGPVKLELKVQQKAELELK